MTATTAKEGLSYAPFFVSKAAITRMRPGSAIINTTSIQSLQLLKRNLDRGLLA